MINSSKLYNIGIAMVFLLAVGLVVYSLWCGIGLTYDSFDYLAAVRSFTEEGRLLNDSGQNYNFHAPLFPIWLSLFGEHPLDRLRICNMLLFVINITGLHLITRKYFNNRWLHVVALFSIGISVGQQMIYNFIWTEPLFLTFLIIHNLFLLQYLKSPRKQHLAAMTAVAFLMCLIRNAGFFILLPSAFILIGDSKEKRMAPAILYFFIGSFGFLLWNMYILIGQNEFVSFFHQNLFFTQIWENLVNYLDVCALWLLPSVLPSILRNILILSVFFLSLILIIRRSTEISSKVFLVQFLIYTTIMICLIKVEKDEIERLMAVVYPWFISGILLLLDQHWEKISSNMRRFLQIGIILWLIYTGTRSLKNSNMWHENHCLNRISMKFF